jgi:hypothetical protein
LAGPCIVVPLLVPVERARRFVPGDVQIVPAAPGRTLGALIGVTYEPGSTLSYSELLVVCASVRSGDRVGGWISHIWVDDEQSVSGGRSIWKLPKNLADFTLDRPGNGTQRFTARSDGATLVRIAAGSPRFRAALPTAAPVPMISGADGTRFFTLGRSGLSAGPARVRVEVPPDSPLAELGFTAAPVGVSGRAQLVMDSPRPI